MEKKVIRVNSSEKTLFFLAEDYSLYYFQALEHFMQEKINSYESTKNLEHLIIRPELFKELKGRRIVNIYQRQGLLLFEERTINRQIRDYTNVELQGFLGRVFHRKFEKTIKYSKITGEKFVALEEGEKQAQFGFSKSDLVILQEEIDFHDNLKVNPPTIFAFGHNPKKLFGISTHPHVVEIDLPKFDVNEVIESFSIGAKNAVLITNKNRAFLCVKRLVMDTRKQSGHSNQDKKNKKKQAKNKNKKIN